MTTTKSASKPTPASEPAGKAAATPAPTRPIPPPTTPSKRAIKLPTKVKGGLPPLRLAVYGEGGTGKTSLALSFPKPLVIDTDGGLEGGAIEGSDGKVIDADEWAPEAWKDLKALYFWLKSEIEKRGYQTIVVDSIDTLCRKILHEATDLPTKDRDANASGEELVTPTQQDYGKVANALDIFLTDLKTLSKQYGVHIVLTSAVRLPDPEKGRTKRTFDVQPAVEGPILYWANVYGELVVEEKPLPRGAPAHQEPEEERILWTKVGDRRRKNKTRFANLRPGVKNPTFEKIAGLILKSNDQKGSK